MNAPTVHVKSLGCRLNQSEAERIAQGFTLAGFAVTPDEKQANVVVLNSCTVTERAGRDSLRASRRKQHPDALMVVTGCHSEVAAGAFTEADLIVANAAKDNLVELTLARIRELDLPWQPDLALLGGRSDGLSLYPLVLESTRAFVKIQDGCNLSCSFCMTTIARGDPISRPLPEVVAEVERLVARGCTEVVLTGVHAASYGREQTNHPDLGDLIQALLHHTDIARIRLSSLEPWYLQPHWFRLWQDEPRRLARSFHMSLQSGADSVLQRMRRTYDTGLFADRVSTARTLLPDAAITTDIITGFPGESANEHAQSLSFVEAMQFAGAHIFTYSERPGTRAETMGDDIPGSIKKQRRIDMLALTDASAEVFAKGQLGSQQDVLWERRHDGILRGLTNNYLKVRCRVSDNPLATLNTLQQVQLVSLDPDSGDLWTLPV